MTGEPSRIAVIGLGEIGARVARHLARAGHAVVGYDIDRGKIETVAAAGIGAAASAGDAARSAPLIVTCVTDGAALGDVVEGRGGLLSVPLDGSTVIDLTSAEPWLSVPLAERLAKAGAGFLDAPVSGGVPAAEAARMNFMVGGDKALLERWRRVLGLLGTDFAHVGPVGAGHTIKALNMLALAANMLATLEVIAIGRRRGLSEQAVNARLIADGAGSYSCDVHLPRFIFPRSYDSGFSFDLMRKDLAIGREVARRAGASAAFGDEVIAFYDAQRELTGADNTRIAEVYLGGEGAEPAETASADFAASLTALMRLTLLCIAAEIVAIGRAAGLDPRDVVRVLSAGSGRSDALSSLAPSDSAEAPVIDGDGVRALRDRGAGAADTHAPLPSRFTSLAMSAAVGVEGGERLTCQELASKVMAARKEHPPASC